MDNNLFSDVQLRSLYGDKNFLEFISEYYSSYSVKDIAISGMMSDEQVEQFWKIYIRILLANINDVMEAIGRIEKNISFSYEEVNVKVAGSIKGRLRINDYVKNKSMVRMPKEYPCVVKEKTFQTVENEYLVFIIGQIVLRMLSLLEDAEKNGKLLGQETEIRMLNDTIDYFSALLRKQPFVQIQSNELMKEHDHQFDETKISLIHTRFAKGKIRNDFAYKRVFDWYEKFSNKGFTWIDENNISIIVYDDAFCNKLFELWNLYSIATTFVRDFDMEILETNPVRPGLKTYVYKLKSIENSIIEIYYQKGSGLYWNNEVKQGWYYVRESSNSDLIGIPDISVKVVGATENITMIDLKNRVRSAGENSEEIYKIIGYFSNFSKFLGEMYDSNYKNQAVLIFRNDVIPFKEELESENGERICALSTGIGNSENVCENQFKQICKYILNIQGITGSKSQAIASCNKEADERIEDLKKAMDANDDESIENIIYDIENKTHSIIKDMFSVGELMSVLDGKKEELRINHFPHIWEKINSDTVNTLAMAECLFSGLAPCDSADYAPVCLEYCRALEIQLNALIFTPFKNTHNVNSLNSSNWNYEKLTNTRELTLGECIFLLEKTQAPHHSTIELKNFINSSIRESNILLNEGVDVLRKINVSVRRKAAHTTIMSYDELLEARQRVLGIGNLNLLYILLDDIQR